jgi:hypothetical protein
MTKIEHAGGEDHLPFFNYNKVFFFLEQLLLIDFKRLLS